MQSLPEALREPYPSPAQIAGVLLKNPEVEEETSTESAEAESEAPPVEVAGGSMSTTWANSGVR